MDDTMGSKLADRSLLRVAGDDPGGFLQGLLTNDVALLRPQTPQWTALLTPQGKVLFDMILWQDGDAVLIDAESRHAEVLARRLAAYRLRRAVTIEPVDAAIHWSPDGDKGVPDPRLGSLGRRWIGAGIDGHSADDRWRAHRLGLGVVEGVAELGSGETLCLEANARELNGVSFAKGCYVGQENTARMHHRAKVNRRLVVAPIGESGDRTRVRYPDVGVMVELRRVDALGDAIVQPWLARAVLSDETASA